MVTRICSTCKKEKDESVFVVVKGNYGKKCVECSIKRKKFGKRTGR